MKRFTLVACSLLMLALGAWAQTRTYLSSTNNVYTVPALQIGGQTFTNLAGAGLTNNNGRLEASGGVGLGTVTSVALSAPSSLFYVTGSPVTGNGTLGFVLTNQTANLFFCGPSSGGPAAPTFRLLSDADIPSAIARDSEVSAAVAALSSVYQPLDSDLSADAGLSTTGIKVRTGSGTAATRTITGDTEAVVSNGDGVSGNPTLSIGAAIARDSEVTAAVAALSSVYQPLSASLTKLSTNDASALTNFNGSEIRSGTVADARIDAAVARLASPSFSGSPTAPTAADGTSNSVVATTQFVMRNRGSGGGSGDVVASGNNTLTGTNAFNGPTTFNGSVALNGSTTVSNLTVSGTLAADTLSTASPIGIASGGTSATTAADARTALGAQAASARLSEISSIAYSTGDLIIYSGGLTRLPIGTNGQVVGVSGGVLGYINQTGTGGGGGVTNFSNLSDVQWTSPVEGQYPGWNAALGKLVNRTPAVNPLLVSWIGAYGIGTQTNMDVATNNVIANFSVPPSASPGSLGRFLQGQISVVLTNTNSLSASFDFTVDVNGTKVIDSPRAFSSGQEVDSVNFRIMYESDTTASFYAEGFGPAAFGSTAVTGSGIYHGATLRGTALIATNVAFTWSNTNSVRVSIGMRNTGGGTTSGIGVKRHSASLYALIDNASVLTGSSPAIDSPQISGNPVYTLQSWSAYSGTNYVVDASRELTITLSTNIAVLHATNRPGTSTGVRYSTIRIVGGSTNWNIAWPASWKRLGTNITQFASNKVALVAIGTYTNETDTTFGISKEE